MTPEPGLAQHEHIDTYMDILFFPQSVLCLERFLSQWKPDEAQNDLKPQMK